MLAKSHTNEYQHHHICNFGESWRADVFSQSILEGNADPVHDHPRLIIHNNVSLQALNISKFIFSPGIQSFEYSPQLWNLSAKQIWTAITVAFSSSSNSTSINTESALSSKHRITNRVLNQNKSSQQYLKNSLQTPYTTYYHSFGSENECWNIPHIAVKSKSADERTHFLSTCKCMQQNYKKQSTLHTITPLQYKTWNWRILQTDTAQK